MSITTAVPSVLPLKGKVTKVVHGVPGACDFLVEVEVEAVGGYKGTLTLRCSDPDTLRDFNSFARTISTTRLPSLDLVAITAEPLVVPGAC
jgi:hypothetical protein